MPTYQYDTSAIEDATLAAELAVVNKARANEDPPLDAYVEQDLLNVWVASMIFGHTNALQVMNTRNVSKAFASASVDVQAQIVKSLSIGVVTDPVVPLPVVIDPVPVPLPPVSVVTDAQPIVVGKVSVTENTPITDTVQPDQPPTPVIDTVGDIPNEPVAGIVYPKELPLSTIEESIITHNATVEQTPVSVTPIRWNPIHVWSQLFQGK